MGRLGWYGWLVVVLAIKCTLVRVPLESIDFPCLFFSAKFFYRDSSLSTGRLATTKN